MHGFDARFGNAMADGYRAHRQGLLLAECPHALGQIRRLWRAGWMEREEAFFRASVTLESRRKQGVL